MSGEVVWTATLDKKWRVEVTRTDKPYVGILSIYEDADTGAAMTQEVGLAYNAQFGPDTMDIVEWQEMAIQFVDNRKETP